MYVAALRLLKVTQHSKNLQEIMPIIFQFNEFITQDTFPRDISYTSSTIVLQYSIISILARIDFH